MKFERMENEMPTTKLFSNLESKIMLIEELNISTNKNSSTIVMLLSVKKSENLLIFNKMQFLIILDLFYEAFFIISTFL